jgi:hypothetical protein
MNVECTKCGKVLKNQFSLSRHLNLIHFDNDDDDSVVDSEENGEQEEESDSDESSESDTTGWQNIFWRRILKQTYENFEELPLNIDNLTREPYFSELQNRLHNRYKDFKSLMVSIDESDLENKLIQTVVYFKDQLDFDDDEAEEHTWNTRANLFKTLVNENEDLFLSEKEDREYADQESVEQEESKNSNFTGLKNYRAPGVV